MIDVVERKIVLVGIDRYPSVYSLCLLNVANGVTCIVDAEYADSESIHAVCNTVESNDQIITTDIQERLNNVAEPFDYFLVYEHGKGFLTEEGTHTTHAYEAATDEDGMIDILQL